MIIAIDGPAGSGKSTIAKAVAKKLGFHYLDTGAMYRAIAWLALERGADLEDACALATLTSEEPIEFMRDPADPLVDRVSIAGQDVTAEIRTPRIDAVVSIVASCAEVRAALVTQQRAIAATRDTVMEGRDIGTVVFPHADVKIFLTASPEERACRRAAQNAARHGGSTSEVEVLRALKERDRLDSTRDHSPLAKADDAREVDTTHLSIDEVVELISAMVEELR